MYLNRMKLGIVFLVLGLIFLTIIFIEPLIGMALAVIFYIICILELHTWIKSQSQDAGHGNGHGNNNPGGIAHNE